MILISIVFVSSAPEDTAFKAYFETVEDTSGAPAAYREVLRLLREVRIIRGGGGVIRTSSGPGRVASFFILTSWHLEVVNS